MSNGLSRGHWPFMSPAQVIAMCEAWPDKATLLLRPHSQEAKQFGLDALLLACTADAAGIGVPTEYLRKLGPAFDAAPSQPPPVFDTTDLNTLAGVWQQASNAMWRIWSWAASLTPPETDIQPVAAERPEPGPTPVLAERDIQILAAVAQRVACVHNHVLAELLRMGRDAVGGSVNSLLDQGYLERPRGKRGGVMITPAGRALLARQRAQIGR